MEMKVEVMSREVIKPASSAPHDRLQLSFMDFNVRPFYIPLIFFYDLEELANQSQDIVLRTLKSSLSKTLSRFYPLAGQIEGISINCNDKGAVFTEVCIDILLPDYLRNLDTNSLKVLLPTIVAGESAESWPLLSTKVSFFGSGSGVSIGVILSHKICDAASVSTFLRAWSSTAKEESKDELGFPQFAGTAIYPPPDLSIQGPGNESVSEFKVKCVTNRFVFESSKIADLKTMAVSKSVPAPTRVEAIMALIWRCARNSSRSNLNVPRSSMMSQAVDLRLRIPSTVLSVDAIGNLQTAFFIKRDSSVSEMELNEIVADFRKAKGEANEMIKEHLEGSNSIMARFASFLSELKSNIDWYGMSSCLRMGFYDVDFGWGRPAWVGYGYHALYDDPMNVMLMDAKDGDGVEAWVGIPEQDMETFICDQELLSYASINPPVLI